MGKFDGIKIKKLKNGTEAVYVLFQYENKRYPEKNFTKLFGCRTKEEAAKKLAEIKIEISKGRDPFTVPKISLNDYYESLAIRNLKTKRWNEKTEEVNTYFYNKYVRNSIGHKAPAKITIDDLNRIIENDMTHLQEYTRVHLRKVLRPIFIEAIKEGLLYENVADKLPWMIPKVKESVETRAIDDMDIIVKKIYKTIPYYVAHKKVQREEIPNFLMFVLLTAHRVGEVRNLTIEDCYLEDGFCIAPETITKTKKPYKFPIPHEVIPYLRNIETGKIFPTLSDSAIDQIWNKLMKMAKVRTANKKSITAHDTRRFLSNIMVRHLKIDSMIADACLNHEERGSKKHYFNITYEDIKNAYEQYWAFVRDLDFEFEPSVERENKKKKRTKAEYAALKATGWERYVPIAERIDPKNPHYRKKSS